jgi:hypothetical protein
LYASNAVLNKAHALVIELAFASRLKLDINPNATAVVGAKPFNRDAERFQTCNYK